MDRLFTTLFIVGFFSALPLWGLSSQQGWVTLTGTRAGPTGPFQTQIVRRNAYSTSSETLEVIGARTEFFDRGRGRYASPTVQLVLDAPQKRREVIRSKAGPTEVISPAVGTVSACAKFINAARDSGRTSFILEITPELSFWFMVGLVVIFGASGLFIAMSGGSPSQAKVE